MIQKSQECFVGDRLKGGTDAQAEVILSKGAGMAKALQQDHA